MVLIHTGMRIEEFWDFVDHPNWYKASRHCISLPKGAIKKVRCVYKERDIILTENGCKAVETLQGLDLTRVSRTAMRDALILAASKSIGIQGVCPKMCRKTAISWLVRGHQDKAMYICSSAGHTLETMRINYLGIAFSKEDIEAMKIFFEGWGNERPQYLFLHPYLPEHRFPYRQRNDLGSSQQPLRDSETCL